MSTPSVKTQEWSGAGWSRAALRSLRAGVLVAAAFALTGCGLFGGGIRHHPAPLPAIDQQNLNLDVVWSTDAGSGTQGYVTGLQLAVDGRRIYSANRDGEVTAMRLDTGDIVWQKQTDLHITAGPSVGQGVLLVGGPNGEVTALSTTDGSELWHVNVNSGVLSAPAIGDNTAVVRTSDGRLLALDLADGQQRWALKRSVPTLTLRGTSSPVIDQGVVYAGMDNGRAVAVAVDNGKVLWEQPVAEPTGRSELDRLVDVDAPLLLVGDQLYAASIGGKLVSISRRDGRIRWKRDIASRTGMAFSGNQLFVSDLQGTVWAVGRTGGVVVWQQDALAYRQLSKPVMYLGYVVVGDFQGYLHFLAPEGGSIIARAHPVGSPIRAVPVVVGNRIYVLSTAGDVVALQESKDD